MIMSFRHVQNDIFTDLAFISNDSQLLLFGLSRSCSPNVSTHNICSQL